MRRKLSLLLAMILAMTLVMGISVFAFADGSISTEYGTFEHAPNCHYMHYVYVGNDTYLKIAYNGVEGSFVKDDSGKIKIDNDEITVPENPKMYSIYINHSFVLEEKACGCEFLPLQAPSPVLVSSSSEHEHSFTWQTIYAASPNSDGLEGEVCSCGVMRNTQPISAYEYALTNYLDQKLNPAKPGQTIVLELGEWNSFPKAFMEKIAAKVAAGETVELRYKVNHKLQKTMIPVGSVVDTTLDWYGPAKMAELYGAN